MKKSIIAFISLITLCIEPLMASAEFSFKKYQVENGLSHNTTWCAIQDSYGFLWIGTSNGLNCYYGSGNKIYRNVLNDKYSLGNNFVSSLMEEGEDLWIGTSSGLYIYDRSDDHFLYFDKTTKYGVFISCEVKKIVKTKNGLIWIATLGQGIFIYDPAKDVLTQNSIRTFFAWDICQGTDSLVYVSSMQEGLLCFDEEGTFLQNYPVSSELSIGNQRINCLHSIEHEIWCGVGTNSLGCYQEGSRELIGCMVTLRDLELDPGLNSYTDGAARESVRHIVGVQFRNLATVGGSIYGRYGFSDVLTMFLTMDSYVELYKGGIIPLKEYAKMPYDRDILVRLIVKKEKAAFDYQSVRNSQTDFPVLTCAAAKTEAGYRFSIGARPGKAVLFELADADIQAADVENMAENAAKCVKEQVETGSNTRGSAEYRKHLAGVLVRRAVCKLAGK